MNKFKENLMEIIRLEMRQGTGRTSIDEQIQDSNQLAQLSNECIKFVSERSNWRAHISMIHDLRRLAFSATSLPLNNEDDFSLKLREMVHKRYTEIIESVEDINRK